MAWAERRQLSMRRKRIRVPVSAMALAIGLTIVSPNGTFARPQRAGENNLTPLEIGALVSRDLSGGQRHCYSIRGVAGQYIRLVVEHRGIDTELTLFGSDGEKLIAIDSSDETQRWRSMSIIAERSGAYRLEVRSPSASPVKGQYTVSIGQMNVATVADRDRIDAQTAFSQGQELRSQEGPPSLATAAEKYERALALYEKAGDNEGQANSLSSLGKIYYALAKPQKALAVWDRELLMRRHADDRVAEASALINIGRIYNELGDRQQALKHCNQALSLHQALGNKKGEDLAASTLASVYVSLGENQKALEFYHQSLSFRQALGDRHGQAVVLSEIGFIHSLLSDLPKALDYLGRALAIHRAMGDRGGEAYSLLGSGSVYVRLGEKRKALECYEEALSIHRVTGSRRGEAYALHNLAWAYDSLGEKRKALDYNDQALRIMRDVGDRSGEAYILHNIASIYQMLGERQKALDRYQQALVLRRVTADRLAEAETLNELAHVERDLGNLSDARSYIESALETAESLRSKVGGHKLRATYQASVQDFYEFYLDLLFQLNQRDPQRGDDAVEFQTSERNRARTLLDLLTEVRADIRQDVDASLLEREWSLQQIITGKTDRRIRLLGGKHTNEQAAEATKELESLIYEYEDVEAKIRATSPRYAALTQPQPRTLSEIQQLLDADTILLEYALGADHSYLWVVSVDSIASFQLPKRAAIEAKAENVYDLLTARTKRVQNETASQREARVAKADVEYVAAGAELSQMLLGPAASQLGKKRLLIVTDGALESIPFAALPVPDTRPESNANVTGRVSHNSYTPLVVEHEIISLPSASVLALLRRDLEGRKSPPRTIAVVADPVFEATDLRVKRPTAPNAKPDDNERKSAAIRAYLIKTTMISEEQSLPRLSYSRKEAIAIAALVPSPSQKKILLDFDANYHTATNEDLGEFRIVHFATHGVLDSDQPELSGILLSLVDEKGSPQENGILRLGEIYNLKLPVDMVVLSGCQTGLGKQLRGEGLIGLTRGFMYAGAPRVLASLWNVNDLATAELMKAFYEGILVKQLRPAEALRRAQIEMWRKPNRRSQYFWAGFVLQGEWR